MKNLPAYKALINMCALAALLIFPAYVARAGETNTLPNRQVVNKPLTGEARGSQTYKMPNGLVFHMDFRNAPAIGAGGYVVLEAHGEMPTSINSFLEKLSTNSLCASESRVTRSRATVKALDWENPSSKSLVKGILITTKQPDEWLEFSVGDETRPLIFCEGSEYTFLGNIDIGAIKVSSDTTRPLQLKIIREGAGYKYMSGKGTITVNGVETKVGQ